MCEEEQSVEKNESDNQVDQLFCMPRQKKTSISNQKSNFSKIVVACMIHLTHVTDFKQLNISLNLQIKKKIEQELSLEKKYICGFFLDITFIYHFSFHFDFKSNGKKWFIFVATLTLSLSAGIQLPWQFAIDSIEWKFVVGVASVVVDLDVDVR